MNIVQTYQLKDHTGFFNKASIQNFIAQHPQELEDADVDLKWQLYAVAGRTEGLRHILETHPYQLNRLIEDISALVLTLTYQNEEAALYLLEQPGIDVTTSAPIILSTPAHLAIQNRSMNVFRRVLELGCDVNAVAGEGQTLLHQAVRFNQVEAATLLLQHPEINPNLLNIHDQTPLSEGVILGHNEQLEIIRILARDPRVDLDLGYKGIFHHYSKPPYILHIAVELQDPVVFKRIAENPDLDWNYLNNRVGTPLNYFIRKLSDFFLENPVLCEENFKTVLSIPQLDLTIPGDHTSVSCLQRITEQCDPKWLEMFLAKAPQTEIFAYQFGDTINKLGNLTSHHTDAEKQRKREIFQAYAADPEGCQLRFEFNHFKATPATLFGLTVFLCDDFFALKPAQDLTEATELNAHKFFSIVKQLPMELQMILSNLAYGKTERHILSPDSENAFKDIVRSGLLSQ